MYRNSARLSPQRSNFASAANEDDKNRSSFIKANTNHQQWHKKKRNPNVKNAINIMQNPVCSKLLSTQPEHMRETEPMSESHLIYESYEQSFINDDQQSTNCDSSSSDDSSQTTENSDSSDSSQSNHSEGNNSSNNNNSVNNYSEIYSNRTLSYPWVSENETTSDTALLRMLPQTTVFLLETDFNFENINNRPRSTTNLYGNFKHWYLNCDRC